MKWLAFASLLLVSSVSQSVDRPAAGSMAGQWVDAFPALKFDGKPVYLAFSGSGDAEIAYVVEQSGRIWSFPSLAGARLEERKLAADLTSVIHYEGGETGLLGLALAPDFASTRNFYASYTAADLALTVARFTLKADGSADLASRVEVIRVPKRQDFKNHNCGMIAFGPDNLLYIGTGDGGGGGDPLGNAQDLGQWLGKILRLDVSSLPYHVPADNPFVSTPGARGEIWALGLRNPWRFSFDRANGELWIGDVGQDRLEEIDFGVRGGNYGWRVYEGDFSYNNPNQLSPETFNRPVLTLGHDVAQSIIGGNVYRGAAIPALWGAYVFGDFVTGKTWWLKRMLPVGVETHPLPNLPNPVAFGQDSAGEIYGVSYGGTIFRLK
jgi:glucose/arabinose dehydrogenase